MWAVTCREVQMGTCQIKPSMCPLCLFHCLYWFCQQPNKCSDCRKDSQLKSVCIVQGMPSPSPFYSLSSVTGLQVLSVWTAFISAFLKMPQQTSVCLNRAHSAMSTNTVSERGEGKTIRFGPLVLYSMQLNDPLYVSSNVLWPCQTQLCELWCLGVLLLFFFTENAQNEHQ